MMKILSVIVLLAISLFGTTITNAAPLNDLVDSLPIYGTLPMTQFSGFLDGTDGCNTEVNGKYCKLHYWLALSTQSNWKELPIILWLNGGPGSTSIIGYLQELGPILINGAASTNDKLLFDNPYAWTNIANVLILEAPIGVGFSYCERHITENKPCQNTDRYTASTTRAAIIDFFLYKFPEFQPNEFYIVGESYAGVYIPTLTKELLDIPEEQIKKYINLKGIAVGDPCTDNDAQENSMDSLWYSHKYGLVDNEIFHLLWDTCNARIPISYLQEQQLIQQKHKQMERKRKLNNMDNNNNNNNNMTTTATSQSNEHNNMNDIFIKYNGGPKFRSDDMQCTLALRKYYLSTSKGLSQSWKKLYIDDYSLFAFTSNLDDIKMREYMNRYDVRKAINVLESPTTTTWPSSELGFDYTKEYLACNWYNIPAPVQKSMIDIYKEIVPKLHTTIIYNGDTDPCVSYEGTRLAVKQIGFNELDGGSYRPWFYNHTLTNDETILNKSPLFGPNVVSYNMGPQFGGEITSYEHNLSFLTIHGSGHMVPQFRPQAALHMITKLLSKQDLSPLLPSNKTLSTMSNDAFKVTLDSWTQLAQSDEFIN